MAEVAQLKLSDVLAALSYALDLTEGQLAGHTLRSCLIGMRLAHALDLPSAQRSALFYALLLKDIGCSSNAARLCALFNTDDLRAKHNFKLVDWSRSVGATRFAVRHAAAHQPLATRVRQLVALKQHRDIGKQLFAARCDRGAQILALLDFGAATSAAVRTLDEHWDGGGQPSGVQGDAIPLLGRILGLAQTMEVFASNYGVAAACDVARKRCGTWFDPALVTTFLALQSDTAFWQGMRTADLDAQVAALEPPDQVLNADDARIERIAAAFAQVVDAKSPWTARHSSGVAWFAVGIAQRLAWSATELRQLRRAALLHDIGKLGVSNLILDKPGPLTNAERTAIMCHPLYTQRILGRVPCFRDLASDAAAHHERLDGRGYHRGLGTPQLSMPARVLAVADICEALSAERPYRAALPYEEVLTVMRRDVGEGICPVVFEALEDVLLRPTATPERDRGGAYLQAA